MNQKGSYPIFVLIGIMIFIGTAAGAYFMYLQGGSNKSNPGSPYTQSTPALSTYQASAAPTSLSSQQNESTSNWKSYVNNKFQFKIKYPDTLDYSEDNNSQIISFFPVGKKENEISVREIHIFISDNSLKLSATDYWKTQIRTNGRPDKPVTKLNLGNLDALAVESLGLDHKRLKTIIVATQSSIYEIVFNEYEIPISTFNKSIHEDVFTQMLNSFEVSK